MSDTLRPLIGKAADGPLTRTEAEAAFNAIMSGDATPAQIGGFLMALRTRGETVDEFAAAAAVMRAKSTPVSGGGNAIDIVGTGHIELRRQGLIKGCRIGNRRKGCAAKGHGVDRQLVYFHVEYRSD